MGILVVGSVAFDSVETPFGKAEEVLGGSGTYFSTAASFFTEVSLVAAIGEDFSAEHLAFLAGRGIDLRGVHAAPGKTFRWKGRYGFDLNEAQTLETHLNVFETFRPRLASGYEKSEFVFLANIDPELQLEVLRQVERPQLVACDTMNFWIAGKREALIRTLAHVDLLVINEGETRQLANEPNLVQAARTILAMGPRILVIKRGEYGVLMATEHSLFSIPAYPLEAVFDPTGAGDTFAGGMMGYLANCKDLTDASLRKAIVFGTIMASFNVEEFSLDRLRTLTYAEIEDRYRRFRLLTEFAPLD
jgi:sugar/nucleoside kinase (ribokinase family)